jgi:ribosomal protein S18 acetylase RimI-like enzyme
LRLSIGPARSFAPVSPTLYLAVAGEVERLRGLRDAVFTGPLHRRLDRDFVPHVTLAQEQPDDVRLTAGVVALAGYRVEVEVDRVHLLEQVARPAPEGGRRWVALADGPFGAPAVVGRGGLELALAVHDTVDPEMAALGVGPPGRLDGGWCVAARREGELVGAAVAHRWGDEVVLTGLAVGAPHRRSGVGRHLVERTVHAGRAAGAQRLVAPPGPLDRWLVTLGWHEPDEPPRSGRFWRPI